MITTVSGPSKSGKTVLCENVIGMSSMLLITGGGVASEEDLWRKIRVKLGVAARRTTEQKRESKLGGGASAKGSVGVKGLLSFDAGLSGKGEHAIGSGESDEHDLLTGVDLLALVNQNKRTLVIDDFHYVPRDIQVSLVEQFKEGARAGCTILMVSVPHRVDDAIRANPDLRGRVNAVEVTYWSPEELRQIGLMGFPILRMDVPVETIDRLVRESLSSPQLMQSLCLEFCRFVGVDDALEQSRMYLLPARQLEEVFRGVANTAGSHTALEQLKTGPRVRGTGRNAYDLKDGTQGDVYTVVLKAMAHGEPRLTLAYADIRDRVGEITNGEPPSGSSITSTLSQMHEMAEKFANEDRILEWDPEMETLNFTDPYFLYFLRWRA